jgi:dipeptidyl aminopeptidase/acylaminoacyl peptidase
MVTARLLAVGLLSASLSVSSEGTGGLPTSKLVVQAMHQTWPDGSPVEHGGRNYPTDIYVVDASGKHVRNLTHDAPTNYLIGPLPRGRRILYESEPSDRMRAGASGIFSINADGSGRAQLASGKGELLPELSPDGRLISFTRGRWLYEVRSDGTHTIALAQTSFGPYPSEDARYSVSWSPDAKGIAFVRDFREASGAGHSALYVINADGTGLRRLTKLRPNVQTMNPAWSPDGRKIAFDENGGTSVMHTDGTHLTRLKLSGAFWLSNDRLAAGRNGSGRYESVDANGTGKPRAVPNRVRVGGNLWITSGRSAGFWPVSPDRKWIAYLGGGSFAGRDISIANLDGTHRRLVTRKICCWLDPGDREPFSGSAVAWAGK